MLHYYCNIVAIMFYLWAFPNLLDNIYILSIMTKTFLAFTFACSMALFFTACEKDDPEIPNEEELITTLNYTLTPQGGGDAIILSFKDLDGEGGDTPTVTTGTLAANQTYTGRLELLNESESPAENITEEIEAEDEEHQFFFESTLSDLTVTYNDQDADGNPIGLSSTLKTGDATTGNLVITLIHEPEKSAAGVSTGDIDNASGTIDLEVTFPVNVQ